MMTNEKLTVEVLKLKKQVMRLETEVFGNKPIEPPVPVPPVNPPTPPNENEIIDIDMSRAYHIDKKIGAGESLVFRFEFAGGIPGANSYVHFTAVQPFSSDGCFKMSIPTQGYMDEECGYETSNGVGTDGMHTRWVVPMNKEIYLHVLNTGGKATLRLKSTGEKPY